MKKTAFLLLMLAVSFVGKNPAQSQEFPNPTNLQTVRGAASTLQRSLSLMAESTAEKRNHVKVLFYGQSITEQDWSHAVADDLRKRFPHADLEIENRAIGGHSSQILSKTAEADLYPFYPDLLVFHVYGDHRDYEAIIRRVREQTTADILLQNDHFQRNGKLDEEKDPANLTPANWAPWFNHVFLPGLAEKYDVGLLDQRSVWKTYLEDNQLTPRDLLRDGVHLNEHGNHLMAEIVNSGLQYTPGTTVVEDDRVTTIPINSNDWTGGQLTIPFEGNRVDVITANQGEPREVQVLVDNRNPSDFPNAYCMTKTSGYLGTNWPCLLQIQRGPSPVIPETWSIRITEASDDYNQFRFTVTGSVSGDDGEGTATETFVSNSGRLKIEPRDWNLAYCRKVFEKPLTVDAVIQFDVVPQFNDHFIAKANPDPTRESTVRLIQGISNGQHTLTLIADSDTPITAVRVYRPPFARQTKSTPNVLVLYADDMGFGDLSIQNPASKIPTPNLDDLARQSMRFSNGHSSSGICTPSRYALLTGRYHWRDFHEIVGPFGKSVFDDKRLTLPEMMTAYGYTTAAIGKWHLGWDWDAIKKPNAKPITVSGSKQKSYPPEAFDWDKAIPGGPLAHGFHSYFGDTVINFPPYCWIQNDRVIKAPDAMLDTSKWRPIKEGSWECRPGPMASDWDPYQCLPTITHRGVEFIHAQKDNDKPFFLYFAFPSPHAPIIPNDAFDGQSEAGPYGDFVVETDNACGQLLDALRESGQADDTIVIFSADNGPENYAYVRDATYDHWSAEPFRGLKRDIYEGGHHVPFLIRWPGVTKPGTVSDSLASQIDIMATLADAIDYALPEDAAEDSHSLLPIIRGDSNLVRTAHVHNTYKNAYAIREENWLLIDSKTGYHRKPNQKWETKHLYNADDDQAVELYDLSIDIGQRHNVASHHPDRVRSMQARLKSIRSAKHSAPRFDP
ncbi:Arylsulfatase [Planctomycetes bacterium CA13]|uniref:Arylsulfatase n=1 Tax=Novipirellula herctigrandis TaxID=2527986 RepID=A0A5C5Z4N6_9BACT|nr:Arylsulfatase [Planctomycetes bacterium CA13]